MSEADLIKLLIGTQISLGSMFVWHLFKCRDTRIDIATIKQLLDRIERDIGDHEHGIRGELHRHSSYLTRHEMMLSTRQER